MADSPDVIISKSGSSFPKTRALSRKESESSARQVKPKVVPTGLCLLRSLHWGAISISVSFTSRVCMLHSSYLCVDRQTVLFKFILMLIPFLPWLFPCFSLDFPLLLSHIFFVAYIKVTCRIPAVATSRFCIQIIILSVHSRTPFWSRPGNCWSFDSNGSTRIR